MTQFSQLNDKDHARDKLKEAKQRMSVSKYIAYFDSIILELPTMQESDLVHAFCYGLK